MVKLRIAKVAQEKGVRISRLQEKSGMPWSMTDRYWHNKIENVSLSKLEKIAAILGVRVTDLIEEE